MIYPLLRNYTQMIKEPTLFVPNKSPLCIDLCFKPRLVSESSVFPTPSQTCHHQIVFGKVNSIVSRPLPYMRELWHFKDASVDLIRQSIDLFD